MLGIAAHPSNTEHNTPSSRINSYKAYVNTQKRSHHTSYPATMGPDLPLSMKLP